MGLQIEQKHTNGMTFQLAKCNVVYNDLSKKMLFEQIQIEPNPVV